MAYWKPEKNRWCARIKRRDGTDFQRQFKTQAEAEVFEEDWWADPKNVPYSQWLVRKNRQLGKGIVPKPRSIHVLRGITGDALVDSADESLLEPLSGALA